MNATAPLTFKEPTAEVQQANTLATTSLTMAQGMIIDSREGYQAAADEVVELRGRWKKIDEQRKHLKEPYLEGCRRIDEFFREPLQRLADAAELVKGRMLTFKREEDRKAEEARRQQEAEARARREELERQQREAAERERQARLEAERVEREARERAEAEARAAREEAERLAAAGDAEAAARAEAEAQAARERGEAEAQAARDRAAQEALEAQQQASQVQDAIDLAALEPALPVAQSAATAHGISGRKVWKVLSIDKAQLVAAAAKALESGDDSLLAYLVVDEKALNGIAKALKSSARVPGVTFGEDTILATTGRR